MQDIRPVAPLLPLHVVHYWFVGIVTLHTIVVDVRYKLTYNQQSS